MFSLPHVRTSIAGLAFATVFASTAQAQVFEIIHPDVEKGQVEVEVLSGVVLEDTDPGDERSAYEFALGYGITSFWKSTVAVEFADINGDGLEYEAFEWENVFLFPLDKGSHGHGDDHGHKGAFGLEALGFYAAL